MIGRELYPLLHKAGFNSIRVSPRMVYVDSSKPEFVEGFTKKTFTAMIEGVREPAIKSGIIDKIFLKKESGIYTGQRSRTEYFAILFLRQLEPNDYRIT